MAKQSFLVLLLLASLLAFVAVASAVGHGGFVHKKPVKKPTKKPWKKPMHYCTYKGSVCHDPVLVGADGQQFYFHGQKDADFCLVSDRNLHINAHFIGLRREGMHRDFTWVQSLGILFGSHQLYVGANKVSTWDENVDQLNMALDGAPILIPQGEDQVWEAPSAGVTVSRIAGKNSVAVEVEGQFRLLAKVVPVSEAANALHNYGVTADNCFAHLEVNFEFFSLSEGVSGVLGQTYTTQYKSLEKVPGQLMPTMGGDAKFRTLGIMSTDCAVSKFGSSAAFQILENLKPMSCSSESSAPGAGMVCRR